MSLRPQLWRALSAGPDRAARYAIDSLSFAHRARWGWGRLAGRSHGLDAERARFHRSIWDQAAADVGATVRSLGRSAIEISYGELRVRVNGIVTSLDDPVTLRVAGDKPLVHHLLMQEGIPVPGHLVCRYDDVAKARRFTAERGGRFVVKPAWGTGAGLGITACVVDSRSLAMAMALAGAHCPEIVVEEQVKGENYRLLYLDGELLDAVRRAPPSVRGDGRSTLRRLVTEENRDRRRGGIGTAQSLVTFDWELEQTLREQGYGPRSVPASGETIRLKTVVSDNRRYDNHPAAGTLCRAVVEVGAAAALAVGVRLAGVDIVTPDASEPLKLNGGAVIEVNTTPSFYYHYMTSGAGVPVAALVLRRLLEG